MFKLALLHRLRNGYSLSPWSLRLLHANCISIPLPIKNASFIFTTLKQTTASAPYPRREFSIFSGIVLISQRAEQIFRRIFPLAFANCIARRQCNELTAIGFSCCDGYFFRACECIEDIIGFSCDR